LVYFCSIIILFYILLVVAVVIINISGMLVDVGLSLYMTYF